MSVGQQVRKVFRTAQVYMPFLQEIGKNVESRLLEVTGRAHDPDLDGLRRIGLPSGAVVFDIGANRGAATMSILRISPGVKIHAFEPNPAMVPRLASLMTSCGGVLHEVALAERGGEFPLFIPVYRGVVFDGLASLTESEAAGWLGPATLFGFRGRSLEIRRHVCRVATMDDLGLQPFFIKIDVQGREFDVLRGGIRTITECEPIIFAESETLDIVAALQLLAASRYSVYRYESRRFIPGMSRRNVYFVPDSKLPLLRNTDK